MRLFAQKLSALLLLTGLFVLSHSTAVCRAADNTLILNDESVLVEFDSTNGTIQRIFDKSNQVEMVVPGKLAENFRLVVAYPENQTTIIYGKNQKLSSATRTGNTLKLGWNGPLKDARGTTHSIAVEMDITVNGGELCFDLSVQNNTANKVNEVFYPIIGGLSQFGKPGGSDTVIWLPTSNPTTRQLTTDFTSVVCSYPREAVPPTGLDVAMSFIALQNESLGKTIYFSSQDDVARYKTYRFEKFFLTDDTNSETHEIFCCIQHHPYLQPSKKFDGSPVVLKVIDGDWRAAGNIYREWFAKTFGITKPKDCWIRQESFYLMTMFELPEGNIIFKFTDIPQWAAEAKKYGVNAVMISGWNRGGHDNGYPYYTPDPRLGTWEELEAGIKACHDMGTKVYFFVNYQPAMFNTDWFKNELQHYRELRPNGTMHWVDGWGMGTLLARLGDNKKMCQLSLGFPEVRKILADQFEVLAKIGADGIHVDKLYNISLDYNPNHQLSPDVAPWEGVILLNREVMERGRKHNPEWAISFECTWDRMLEFTGSTWWTGNQVITREVFPENAETQLVGMAYDFLGINNLVRDGHQIMVSPLNFCQSMDWEPWHPLSEYIREVKRIRDHLEDIVYFGKYLPREDVLLDSVAAGVEYRGYCDLATQQRGCIFTNATMHDTSLKLSGFAGGGGNAEVRVHTPNQPIQTLKLPAQITIPAERIVFVEEAGAKFPIVAKAVDPKKEELRKSQEAVMNAILAKAKVVKDEAKKQAEMLAAAALPLIRLENNQFVVEVSRERGVISRVFDKATDFDLIREPRLADNFRFTLQIQIAGNEGWETIEGNYICGKNQQLSSFDTDETTATLRWDGPFTNDQGETFDASATMVIELTGDGIVTSFEIDNQTPYKIGEVFFPTIGGIQGVGNTLDARKATKIVRPVNSETVDTANIFHTFGNMFWLGNQGPEQYCRLPVLDDTWMAMYSPGINRSVNFGVLDTKNRTVAFRLEMFPGTAGAIRGDGNWPRPEEYGSLPLGVDFSFVDFPNSPPGQKYIAPPVMISFHEGNWKEGVKIMKTHLGQRL